MVERLVGFCSFTTRSTTKAIVSRLHAAENEDTDQSGTLPYSYDRRDLSGSLSCPEIVIKNMDQSINSFIPSDALTYICKPNSKLDESILESQE